MNAPSLSKKTILIVFPKKSNLLVNSYIYKDKIKKIKINNIFFLPFAYTCIFLTYIIIYYLLNNSVEVK